MLCAPHDRRTFLVSGDQVRNTEFRACGRNDCVKKRHPLATAKIGSLLHHISETCKKGRNLLLFTHRKSHTCFPSVPKLLTLNDLERRNGRYFALFRVIRPLSRTHPRKMLDTLMLMTLVDGSRLAETLQRAPDNDNQRWTLFTGCRCHSASPSKLRR